MSKIEQDTYPRNGVPVRDRIAPMVASTIDLMVPVDPAIADQFRAREFDEIADQIINLPTLSFEEARERELLRTTQYYEAFATLFGVDLREVARTRSQINATAMFTSPIIMQAIFNDEGQVDEKGLTFFDAKIRFAGFDFSARSVNIIEGYPFSFSVLKRKSSDESGEYEFDYPAISLSRELLHKLHSWHTECFPETNFEDNPVITGIAQAFANRIHDWVHQAILYDTGASSTVFKKWSENSFFVKHFFPDPLMINYEFMSDKIHYLVWQQLFTEHPDQLTAMMDETKEFYAQLDQFELWLNMQSPKDIDMHRKMTNMFGFVGTRGLFNIISFELLENELGSFTRYQSARSLLPQKYEDYIAKLHQPIDQLSIPFRKGKDDSLSLEQILQEYVDGLITESHLNKVLSANEALWRMQHKGELNRLLLSLPQSIVSQIEEHVDLREFDPRILVQFDKMATSVRKQVSAETYHDLISAIEIDPDGYFYFRLNQKEVDLAGHENCAEVSYQKSALLVQVPWDFEGNIPVVLTRSRNVLAQQKGAEELVEAGDLILINIENDSLAKKLSDELQVMKTTEQFMEFWDRVDKERQRGHVALGDAYPYEIDKALEVFAFDQTKDLSVESGRTSVRSGYYRTKPAVRKVARLPGPISMDAQSQSRHRRRVLFGGIAQNHAQIGTMDIFPVDAISFDRFYKTDRLSLPIVSITNVFTSKYKLPSIKDANAIVDTILQALDKINAIRIHGVRGKPNIVRLRSILSQME